MVVRADRLRVGVLTVVNLALAVFAIAGIAAGQQVWGGVVLATAAIALAGLIYVLRAPPRLVIGPRSVQIQGVEVPWEQVSDVYISHESGAWAFYGSRQFLLFRLIGPDPGLLQVPLSLTNTPWEAAIERIERSWGRPVANWEDSDEMRRLQAQGSGDSVDHRPRSGGWRRIT
jgi:hypothetical protein